MSDSIISIIFYVGLFVVLSSGFLSGLIDGGNRSKNWLIAFLCFGAVWIAALFLLETPPFKGIDAWILAVAAFTIGAILHVAARLVAIVVRSPARNATVVPDVQERANA